MKEFDELISIIKKLHSPQGCPWDRAQKLGDYKKFLLEEVYELVEAIESGDFNHVKEEIGDVFLILASISYLFDKKNKFKVNNALEHINQKLISRHPHVFGQVKTRSKDEVLAFWIKNKAEKKNRKNIKDRLPLSAPALLMADIFLKERGYLKGIKSKDKRLQFAAQAKKLVLISKKIAAKRFSRKLLADLLICACSIGYSQRIELETLLRHEILSQAEKITYKK